MWKIVPKHSEIYQNVFVAVLIFTTATINTTTNPSSSISKSKCNAVPALAIKAYRENGV
jgi:hypothetical protein